MNLRNARMLMLAIAGLIVAAVLLPGTASASGGNLKVTFVARQCPTYASITANRARNNIQESLQNLGANTAYTAGQPIDPDTEALNQPLCLPIVDWRFTLGTGILERASTGPWGALSIVTTPFSNDIVTKDEVPLFNPSGGAAGGKKIQGAVTIELNDHMSDLAANPGSLWVQGGTPTDPVLDVPFPGQYGFGALRCAIDNLNGDNVEWISAPAGTKHVLCYAYYVKPPPTSGTIIVRKQVDAPTGTAQQDFRFTGNISYTPDQSFTLGAAPGSVGSTSFYRSATGPADQPWSFTETVPAGWQLTDITCTSATLGSTFTTNTATGATSVTLAAGDTVTCTYTDKLVPPAAGLTLSKITRGNVGTFTYDVAPAAGGAASSATVTTTQRDVETLATPSFSLPAGDYTVTETLPSSSRGKWAVKSVVCNGQQVTGTINPLTLALVSGQGAACTFENEYTPIGSIRLRKNTIGSYGTTGFVISRADAQYEKSATTTKSGDTAVATGDDTSAIPLGSYVIQETNPTDRTDGSWRVNGVECNGEAVPSDEGRIVITLTADDPDFDCTFVNEFQKKETGEVKSLDATPITNLAIRKTVSPKRTTLGKTVLYTISVRNKGTDDAQNVTIAEQLQRGGSIVSFPKGYHCHRTPFPTCAIGTLKAGKHVVLRVRVKPRRAGSFLNRVAINTSTEESSLQDNVGSTRLIVHSKPRFTG